MFIHCKCICIYDMIGIKLKIINLFFRNQTHAPIIQFIDMKTGGNFADQIDLLKTANIGVPEKV